jgi:hypothetical protein
MHATAHRDPTKRNYGCEDPKLPKRAKAERAAARGKDRAAGKAACKGALNNP